MADVLEAATSHLERLTSVLTWSNVQMLTGGIALLWAAVAVSRRLRLLSHIGALSRIVAKPMVGLRSKHAAAAAEKSGDFVHAGLQYERLGDSETRGSPTGTRSRPPRRSSGRATSCVPPRSSRARARSNGPPSATRRQKSSAKRPMPSFVRLPAGQLVPPISW